MSFRSFRLFVRAAARVVAALARVCASVRLPQTRGGRIALSLAVVYFAWGSTYLGVHVALESFPPLLLSGLRNLFAGIGLFVFAMRRRPPLPNLIEVRNAGIVGTMLVGVSSGMLAYGMRTVGTGPAAVLIATVPLFATLIAATAGSRIAGGEWAAIALGLAGIAVLSHGGGASGSPGGSLAILCGALAWAGGAHLASRLTLPSDLFVATALQIGLGGAISTTAAWIAGERMGTLHFLPALAFVYLMLIGTMAAYVAYGYLIRHTSPVIASSCMYVNPVVAVALGALLLGEPVTSSTVVATMLILASVGLSFVFDRRRAR
ncbi:EamA-like transporter family protein [Paraburkholderia caballeronis]|uniref:EamA family transporter n=1 Tax=Paraburkholderia caballeronis TaxID=416943 RepID=UPI001066B6CD|nr:EamA family transporter [Paraburkholderia caballeronis]TDV38328.1 EamA-like transporter family protein [Paraburkholderia caballeronis]